MKTNIFSKLVVFFFILSLLVIPLTVSGADAGSYADEKTEKTEKNASISNLHAIMRITDEGECSSFIEFDVKNIGDFDLKSFYMEIPYGSDKVNIWHAIEEGHETEEGYLCSCGSFFSEDEYNEAHTKAGLASYSAVDCDSKSVNGLVYAAITYPKNAVKNELVCVEAYKKLSFKYDGWDSVPPEKQRSVVVSKTTRLIEYEEPVKTHVYSKNGRTYLEIELKNPLKKDELSRVSMYYKIYEKVASERVIREDFSSTLITSPGLVDVVISIIPPPHDSFILTKPKLNLVDGLPREYEHEYEYTYGNAKVYAPESLDMASITSISKEQSGFESKALKKEREVSNPSFVPSRVYRVIIPEVPPGEEILIKGYYTTNQRRYGVPFALLVIIIITLVTIKRNLVGKTLHTAWEYLK